MRKKAFILAIFCFCAALICPTLPVFAEEAETPEEAPTSTSLEISPITTRVKLDPGEKQDDKLIVKNTSTEPLKVRLYATPYSDSIDGTSRDFETMTPFTHLSEWITIKSESGEYQKTVQYTLAPDETKTISYMIEIPKVSAGGQYAVLFVETIPEEDPSNPLQTSSRAGMTIFATINGDITRAAEIKDVYAGTIENDIGVKATIVNSGNIDFNTTIEITVSSVFGNTIFADSKVITTFPETTKEVSDSWGKTPFFGLYRINYTIRAADQTVESERLVLIAPIPILIVLVLLLVIILVLIFTVIRNKRHIKF